jgi:2-dehydro-3-deoxygalactonokinase
MTNTLLGVDWGTSNRRAYLVARGGLLLASHSDDQGLLAVAGKFPEAVADLRRKFDIGPEVPAILSGMVGSTAGWQEVPYLDAATPLAALPAHLVAVDADPACRIVPGYVDRGNGVDVMRGEETQLLGALALGLGNGWVVLPGTHSKWVSLQGGAVAQLATFMTGELFAMLAAGGTLAGLMRDGADDEAAFAGGLAEARRGKPLSHTLFGVRARVVAGAMPAAQARSWISGLLIGTEFSAARAAQGERISVIASAALSARYAAAADHFGMQARVFDPDQVYLAALGRFFDAME